MAEALKEEIAEVVGFELNDPRLEAVTVTDVSVSDDMHDAKVYVLVQGSEAEIKEAFRGLEQASTFVRRQVAMNLNLRFAPHIHFARDTAEENAARVSNILDGLAAQGEFKKGPDEQS